LINEQIKLAVLHEIQQSGLSKKDFAEKVGIKPIYLYRLLSGDKRFSFRLLELISNKLKLKTSQLLRRGEKEYEQRNQQNH
jgi:transcriptional regulator with XRE-family HTH domain